jgi:hypothetical protein
MFSETAKAQSWQVLGAVAQHGTFLAFPPGIYLGIGQACAGDHTVENVTPREYKSLATGILSLWCAAMVHRTTSKRWYKSCRRFAGSQTRAMFPERQRLSLGRYWALLPSTGPFLPSAR